MGRRVRRSDEKKKLSPRTIILTTQPKTKVTHHVSHHHTKHNMHMPRMPYLPPPSHIFTSPTRTSKKNINTILHRQTMAISIQHAAHEAHRAIKKATPSHSTKRKIIIVAGIIKQSKYRTQCISQDTRDATLRTRVLPRSRTRELEFSCRGGCSAL